MKGWISSLMAGALAILAVIGIANAAQDIKVVPAPRSIDWSGPGNKDGDATTTTTTVPPKVTSPTGTGPTMVTPAPPVSCAKNGYIENPADKTTYYECQFNPAKGTYDVTLRYCPSGYTYNSSLIRCTN